MPMSRHRKVDVAKAGAADQCIGLRVKDRKGQIAAAPPPRQCLVDIRMGCFLVNGRNAAARHQVEPGQFGHCGELCFVFVIERAQHDVQAGEGDLVESGGSIHRDSAYLSRRWHANRRLKALKVRQ